MVDPEKLELGGASAMGGFVGEMQVPVTGKVSLSFPQLACGKDCLSSKIGNKFDLV